MLFTDELFESARDIWESYNNHPFVDGIGSGELDLEKFKFYMIQDYLYLMDYAKVYSIGASKSLNFEDMKTFSSLADEIFNSELNVHKGYLRKLGVEESEIENMKFSIHNLAYTHYMLAVSLGGDALDVAVAVLSCSWSYKYIADKLLAKYGIKDNFYGDWIKGYTSSEYEKSVIWNLDIVNKLADGISESRKARLKEIFVNCSRFEYMFWEMSYKTAM